MNGDLEARLPNDTINNIMGSRKIPFENNEYYHIYNRGVDKREVFLDKNDFLHFFAGLREFNQQEPIGNLNNKSSNRDNKTKPRSKASKLIEIVAFCLNPNHFHLLLKQNSDKGIEKFMQKLGTSYTKYFNSRNKRNGALFQDKFKSKRIGSNEYLLYLSAYINLNNKIHNIPDDKMSISSIKEYQENINGICDKSIILDQYENNDKYISTINDLFSELVRQKKEKREVEAEFGELI